MIVVGLTGSIGMGKSATANMFRAEGIPVHDSDAAVHELYLGAAKPMIMKHFPLSIVDGEVSRARLGEEVIGKPERMHLLESLIHPLVEKGRSDFIRACHLSRIPIVVVDIPLLFEIAGERFVDIVVVCDAPDTIQEQRVLARAGMTKEKFLAIRAKQVANSEKRRSGHVIIDTSAGFEYARKQVQKLLRALCAAT